MFPKHADVEELPVGRCLFPRPLGPITYSIDTGGYSPVCVPGYKASSATAKAVSERDAGRQASVPTRLSVAYHIHPEGGAPGRATPIGVAMPGVQYIAT